MEIASALLAGVLARFGVRPSQPCRRRCRWCWRCCSPTCWRRLLPRYAVVLTLTAGIAWAAAGGQMRWSAVHLAPAMPVFCRRSSACRR